MSCNGGCGGGGGIGHLHPPGNIFFTGVTRSEKIHRKRFAMSISQQHVPRIMFMQISATITEKTFIDLNHTSGEMASSDGCFQLKYALSITFVSESSRRRGRDD